MKSITDFFEAFKVDFKTFDGVLIASRFVCPLIVVDAEGKLSNYESIEAIARYFQEFLDDYKSKGVSCCEYKDLEIQKITEHASLATLTWELFNAEEELVVTWRESYNLILVQDDFKVVATYDH